MALNIKDPQTERAARALAPATGEGITHAVRVAVEERLARIDHDQRGRDLTGELIAIGDHCAALPDLDRRTAEEILGYDEHGLPT